MKTALIFLAVIALAFGAAIKEDKKEEPKDLSTEKPTEKPIEEKTTEKPIEKPAAEKKEKNDKPEDGHLQWPLPDSHSEGDLILYGKHLFDRVEELHKAKPDNDADRMILDVGRDFLRKCNKYLESARDFKIVPALCRDSRELFKNVSRRWEIRLEAEQAPAAVAADEKKEESANKDNKQQAAVVAAEQPKPQSDAAQTASKTRREAPKEESKEEKKDKDISTTPKPDDRNSTDVNVTEPSVQKPEADAPARPAADQADRENYEARRTDFYRRMGDNFARLLLKSWRKEKLSEEERVFVENWSAEEAIHYGTMGIYCQEGENVQNLIKKIKEIAEEK